MNFPGPPSTTLRTLLAPPQPGAPALPRWPAGLALLVLTTVAYLALGRLGFLHLALDNGVLFSVLWLAPRRCWPWAFAGTVLARTLGVWIAQGATGDAGDFLRHWDGPVQFLLGAVVEPFLLAGGVLLLRRWRITPHTPPSLQQIIRVLLAAVVAATAVMAKDLLMVWNGGGLDPVPGAGIVPLAGPAAAPDAVLVALSGFRSLLGTFLGIVLVAPLLAWAVHAPSRAGSAPILRQALLLLPLALLFLLWASVTPGEELVELARRMMLVAVVVFAVLHGWRGASVALLVVLATAALESHLFPGAAHPWRMQLFSAVTGATALLFGATVDGLRAQTGQLQQAKDESERLAQELNAAARRNLLTEERERRRLAGELHDEFGQTLTALQTRLMLVAPQLVQDGHGAAVDSLVELTRAMRANISGVLESLRPSALEQLGLYRAIDQGLVRRLAEDAGVALETMLEGDARLMPLMDDTLRMAAYRLVQEGVTNVVRHARADHCRVRLRVNQRRGMLWLFVEIRDDGIGPRPGRGPGRGLANMHDRVLALGGRLHLAPRGNGLRLHALLRQPLEAAALPPA